MVGVISLDLNLIQNLKVYEHKLIQLSSLPSLDFNQSRRFSAFTITPPHFTYNQLQTHISNMSSNVGLNTPRGSGTSGYVQKNSANLRHRDNNAPYPKDGFDSIRHRQRQPDQEILEHDRKREIEVKVFELRDKLEDEGYVYYLDGLADRSTDVSLPIAWMTMKLTTNVMHYGKSCSPRKAAVDLVRGD